MSSQRFTDGLTKKSVKRVTEHDDSAANVVERLGTTYNWYFGWLIILILPASLMFFIGGPSVVTSFTVRYLWNLGHILFFFVVAIALFGARPKWASRYFFHLIFAISLISIAIEISQSLIGRNFSVLDVGRNLTGFILGLLAIQWKSPSKFIAAFGIIFLLADLTGFAITASIDWQHKNRMPVIEDFESSLFRKYWHGRTELSTIGSYSGSTSAMFELQPARYSGVSIHPVPEVWRPYSNLSLAVFNGTAEKRVVTIRVNDKVHELSEQHYNDRFNQQFEILPGWNEITIPLSVIANAAANRQIDLEKMFRIGVFVSRLESPMILGLDAIRLKH